MVSPAEEWNELENGYENNNITITVTRIQGSEWEDGRSVNFERWQVRVRRGASGYGQVDEIAEYDEPRPAWELAHMLTHLFEEYDSNRVLLTLTDPEKGQRPTGIGPTDNDPETHLRNCLGYEEHMLDAIPT